MTLEEILDLPISKLTFMSGRARNVLLRRIKINTLAQLDEWAKDPENQLRRIRECGGKTVAEIVNVCHHYGITVNDKDELIAAKPMYAIDDSDVQYFLIDIDDIDRSSMYDSPMISMDLFSSDATAKFKEVCNYRYDKCRNKTDSMYLDGLLLQLASLEYSVDKFFKCSLNRDTTEDIKKQFEELKNTLIRELNKNKEEEN